MGFPVADFNREAKEFTLPREHIALTASTTVKLYKVPAGRKLRVDRVQYYNVTGLVEDNDNNFAFEVKNGSVVVASVFNTDANLDPDTGASLPANTNVTAASVDGANVLSEGDELTAVFTETGTATLPAGFYIIEGRLL